MIFNEGDSGMTRIEAIMERDEEIKKMFYALHPDVVNLVDYIYNSASDRNFEILVGQVGIQVVHGNQGWKYGRGEHPKHYIFESKVSVTNPYGKNPIMSIKLHCTDGLGISLLLHWEEVNARMYEYIDTDTAISSDKGLNTLRLASLYLLAHSDHVFEGLGERSYEGEFNTMFSQFYKFKDSFYASCYLNRFLFDVRKGDHTEVLREFIKHSGKRLTDILDLCNQYQLDELTMAILRIIEEEKLNVGQEQFRL